MIDFEEDLKKLKDKMMDREYALKAYHSLANTEWVHRSAPSDWKDILEQENLDWKRKREAWFRRFPIWFIRLLRSPVIWAMSYVVREEITWSDGHKSMANVMHSRPFWSWINYKLMQCESPFFVKMPPEKDWIYSCSWRYAGGMIAEIRGKGEDYMDYYCSGREGYIDDEFSEDMMKLGWEGYEL